MSVKQYCLTGHNNVTQTRFKLLFPILLLLSRITVVTAYAFIVVVISACFYSLCFLLAVGTNASCLVYCQRCALLREKVLIVILEYIEQEACQ
jgi:hypothetical protein